MEVYTMFVGPRKVIVATTSKEDKTGLQLSIKEGDILELALAGKRRQISRSRGFFCMKATETEVFLEVANVQGTTNMLKDSQYRDATPSEIEQHFRNLFASYSKRGRKIEMISRITAIVGEDEALADIFLKAVCSTVETGKIDEIETAMFAVKLCMDSPTTGQGRKLGETLRKRARAGPVAEKFQKMVQDDSTDVEELDDGDSFEQYGGEESTTGN